MDIISRGKKVIADEVAALQVLQDRLDHNFVDAVTLLQKIMEERGKIVVVGVGKSGNIGDKLAATLTSTGSTAVILNAQNALHGDLGLVRDGDAIIALSYSGETEELVNLLPHLKRFSVKIIGLTGHADSTLGRHADVIINTAVDHEACPLNLAPTSSTTAMLVMADALAMALLEARGFTCDQFARYHPGGALGKALLTKVSDIMRANDSFACISDRSNVRDALEAMTECRAGACVIIDSGGELAGIFTHGDFVRAYQQNTQIGSSSIAESMTRNPVKISADSLATEALKIAATNRIDDIVVVDTSGKPVGLIDTQDLARLKII